jgi:glycosyltransferase involved in cell wall biosynthesis
MKRILIFSPDINLPGGVNVFIKLLDKYLVQEKFEIKYFFTGAKWSIWKDLFYPLSILVQCLKLKRTLKEFKPELIHLNPSLGLTSIISYFLFLKILKKEGYPALLFIHGWQENLAEKFQHKFFKLYFKKRFQMADAIVVLANQFKEKLLDLGINSEKIYVASTMVESASYLYPNKDFSKPFKILYCGYMKKEKGLYELLNAVPLIIEKYPETSFSIMGDGKELKKLKSKTKEIGIDNNVHFPGYKTGNDKIKIFKQAHIFVFPSYSEGFPIVILEAMAAGLPLIITPVGGLADAIKDSKNGFVINTKIPNPKEIADKVIKLIENPNLMKIMSENNMNEAKDKYDAKIVTEKIIKIYNNICSKK